MITDRRSIAVGYGNKTEAMREKSFLGTFALKRNWERRWSFDAQKDSPGYSCFFCMEKFSERIWRKIIIHVSII